MNLQWNPWHGCKKISAGCKNCYVYYLDSLRNKDASSITLNKSNLNLPLKKDRNGNYKIPGGCKIYTCFTSDFFLEEADEWREYCWNIIRKRPDINFIIPTKRIERFNKCLPSDWKEGYKNVTIALTCENQAMADKRIPIFLDCKIQKRIIFASPLLEEIDFSKYLKIGLIDEISVGGESYENARVCDFSWVKKIKDTCDEYNVKFNFHQTGSNFFKDKKYYKINHFSEYEQAKKAIAYLNTKK